MKDILSNLVFNIAKNNMHFTTDLPFLPERLKIEKVKILVNNLHDKTEDVIHVRSLNDGLILEKYHRVIQFNQKSWLKPYIDMNTKLRKKPKNNFEKDFFKLMNNTMENVRKHRNITFNNRKEKKLFIFRTKTTKFFIENQLVIEIRKTETLINKPVYLGLSILYLSKSVIYEFWSDYVKQKYVENVKPCYLDIDSFIVHVKTYNIYKYITEDSETMFDNSNFELDRPLLKGKNKKSNRITAI